ncbi:exodeoxyribonuclease VII large subunit [Aquibacillus albus]|uniref:Exodeoxyribonuclease 7 large subunit n=1 Tax=Aquibacillus albus TaxID=1168171 RepID=A0ABS2MV95_9BACI|nr:exodeoxyribonuclease VII large subunit [Aquibacillus albus]
MKEKYLTVTALTKYIKRKFELDNHLKGVWLKGEISNFNHHSRGHMYLTIKDDHSRIQAVMFASNNRLLKFKPENGMNVLVKGQVNIYPPQGQYQLYIQQMEPDGIGALYLAFEQLKEKLKNEGLFDESRKTPIPRYPTHIGVITSPTGAAIRDIITTIRRRYPIVNVSVLPVLVQGEYAKDSIVQAIQLANQLEVFDVLIVGRGGGSIEELWSFNEEEVARAITSSNIPVISAVGHETDFTISDFVADMRAATPTGAAEFAVPSQRELKEKISGLEKNLNRIISEKVKQSNERILKLKKSYAFRYPEQLIQQKEQELDKTIERMSKALIKLQGQKSEKLENLFKRFIQQHPEKKISQNRESLSRLRTRHQLAFNQNFSKMESKFSTYVEKLTLLNPLNTMKRGYSIAYDEDGKVIQTVNRVHPGDKLSVKFYDGTIDCQVWGLEEDSE